MRHAIGAPGMTGYRWLWVAWFGAFVVLEFTAIFRHRGKDTLSEFVWWLCKVTPGSTFANWTALHIFIAMFLTWLWIHIVLGLGR